MAKRKKSNNSMLVLLVTLLFAAVSIVMLFLPGVKVENYDLNYKIYQVAFGYSEEYKLLTTRTIEILNTSFVAMLPIILLVVGVVLVVLKLVVMQKSGLIALLACVAFVAAGVLFFMMPNFVEINKNASEFLAMLPEAIKNLISGSIDFELAYGAIVAGVCSVLAGLSSIGSVLVK